MAFGLSSLGDVFLRAITAIPQDKACQSYTVILALVENAEKEECSWNEVRHGIIKDPCFYHCLYMNIILFLFFSSQDFRNLVSRLHKKINEYMKSNINKLIDTDGWKMYLTKETQEQLKKGNCFINM